MAHLRGHQGAQLPVGAEIVDTHDAVARVAADRQHALLRTQREYQLAVLDTALHRGQALARCVELDDAGVRPHLDAQCRRLARGIGVDQVIRLLAHRQRHRDSRLRIHQAVTGTDQQHRPLRFASADGLCNRPACNAGADDHHVICAAPALRRLAAVCLLRTGRRKGLHDLRQQSQIALGQTAQRALPVVGDIGIAGTRREAGVRIAAGLVIDEATGIADPALKTVAAHFVHASGIAARTRSNRASSSWPIASSSGEPNGSNAVVGMRHATLVCWPSS